MNSTVSFILEKCVQHVANGGKVLRGLNGVTYAQGSPKFADRSLFNWESFNFLNTCCPLGVCVLGNKIGNGQLLQDAANTLGEPRLYTDGFVFGFDDYDKAVTTTSYTKLPDWKRGCDDGREVLRLLAERGIAPVVSLDAIIPRES